MNAKYCQVISDVNIDSDSSINIYNDHENLKYTRTRGPADLSLDIGQIRMKPWKPNNDLL